MLIGGPPSGGRGCGLGDTEAVVCPAEPGSFESGADFGSKTANGFGGDVEDGAPCEIDDACSVVDPIEGLGGVNIGGFVPGEGDSLMVWGRAGVSVTGRAGGAIASGCDVGGIGNEAAGSGGRGKGGPGGKLGRTAALERTAWSAVALGESETVEARGADLGAGGRVAGTVGGSGDPGAADAGWVAGTSGIIGVGTKGGEMTGGAGADGELGSPTLAAGTPSGWGAGGVDVTGSLGQVG